MGYYDWAFCIVITQREWHELLPRIPTRYHHDVNGFMREQMGFVCARRVNDVYVYIRCESDSDGNGDIYAHEPDDDCAEVAEQLFDNCASASCHR